MDAAYTGSQIARLRKELGLTQRELAEQLHVTDKAVSKWERGINFPDLGLMEALGESLRTTPAVLLGLENATQEEIVSSYAEISHELLEDSRKDVRRLGWSCIVLAVLLWLVYQWIPHRTVWAYYTLHGLIIAAAILGKHLLSKYEEVKKWEPTELFISMGILIPVLIYLGTQFLTGHSPHPIFGAILISIGSCCTQWLFCRVMRAELAKAIPLIPSAGFALWHGIDGSLPVEFALPGICCLAVWAVCFLKNRK